ncbi:MAG: low affinity iron permease family protein [Deltaproteobacteria bacterium]|nr:MAG: low affinity iron permease family protein [Deltaproteobacteria bacterium]
MKTVTGHKGEQGAPRTSSFGRFSRQVARATGQPAAFGAALAIVLLWAVVGPFFGFSDTWQLVINTGTTIITFLMVFLIQNTQNRDSEAMQIKLDELIRAIDHAQNALLNLEELEEKDLERIRANYVKLADQARNELHEEDSNATAVNP